jgi:ribosomal protein S18 acetylase RimI-like enzyme
MNTKRASLIRPYETRDLQQAVDIWFGSWTATFPRLAPPWPHEGWRSRFEAKLAEGATVFIAEESAQVVGFALLFENIGRLDQLFVRPDAQSRGIGTELLNLTKARCPRGLHLDTQQANIGARRFYERHGFLSGREGINKVNGQPNVEYVWAPVGPPQ